MEAHPIAPATAPPVALVHQPSEYHGLQMRTAPAEAERQMRELQAFVDAVMVSGVDYDVIVEGQKPSLLQPGAQKLCELYGLAPTYLFDQRIEDWDRGFFYYLARVELRDIRSGALVGTGLGSCNSKEKKYAGRWVPLTEVAPYLKPTCQKRQALNFLFPDKLPKGVTTDGLPTRQIRSKKGKDYTLYGVTVEEGFVPNEDVYSIVNTILKMALKRALVHAITGVTRSSGLFSQDIEDLPEEAYGAVAARRPWEEPIDAEIVVTPAAAAGGAAAAHAADPLAEKRARHKAALEGAANGPAFTAAWQALASDSDYQKLREGFRDVYTRQRERFWPTTAQAPAAAGAATAAAASATPAAAAASAAPSNGGASAATPAAAAPDPKRERALSMISTAGGDEEEATWDALNTLYDGNIPIEVTDRFNARWPEQPGAKS